METPVPRLMAAASAVAVAVALTATGGLSAQSTPLTTGTVAETTLLVLAGQDAGDAAVRSAIADAGGQVTGVNGDIGLYTVSTTSAGFAAAARKSSAISGVGTDKVIGSAPSDGPAKARDVEKAIADGAGSAVTASSRSGSAASTSSKAAKASTAAKASKADPLSYLQWDMSMIRTDAAHKIETGRGVRVGIMDTGVDATHPDLAARVNVSLSRNFTVDIPSIDGSCADEPDKSCNDPATVDENGHGTHVAGTIASPKNGRGIVGVAPGAEIVNLRVGQDSGYFFLKPTVEALTYAANHGIDVVNMSYYIDPWLYNCTANPADSAEAQAEQRMIIAATNRALKYAHDRGVTLVAAAGNENSDLDAPTADASSPDFPVDKAYPRTVDNSCLSMPTEGAGVISVSSVGPSGLKADYSNWGQKDVDIAAPGGYFRDFFGAPAYRTEANLVLAPMPKALAIASGSINATTGASSSASIIAECPSGLASCAYYQYLQGTSMASPHAAGVAALIVGRWGQRDWRHGGLKLSAWRTGDILMNTAAPKACPAAVYDYPDRGDEYTAACTGPTRSNSWYGEGIVDAYAAVAHRR